MSSRMTFIDNNEESGDWCVILLDGYVVHEGHNWPAGDWFVEFFKNYQGIAESVDHIHLPDESIMDWRQVLYGEE